jgi:transcriptional regulator with XRE-family HTH domain
MSFYDTMDYIMRNQGVTAAELSRRSGVSRQYLTELKSGRIKDVTWSKACAIVRALGVTLEDFAMLEKTLAGRK